MRVIQLATQRKQRTEKRLRAFGIRVVSPHQERTSAGQGGMGRAQNGQARGRVLVEDIGEQHDIQVFPVRILENVRRPSLDAVLEGMPGDDLPGGLQHFFDVEQLGLQVGVSPAKSHRVHSGAAADIGHRPAPR